MTNEKSLSIKRPRNPKRLDLDGRFFYDGDPMKMKAMIAMAAGWFVPGLGHIVQKKTSRGLIFFGAVAAMTTLGLAMGGRVYGLQTENPLTVLAFFADLGNGLFYFLARLFSIGGGTLEKTTFEFGTAYIAGAGLLNYLIAIDAYDIAAGKKK